MPEHLSAEHEDLRRQARRLLDELRPLEAALPDDPRAPVPPEVPARVRELSREAGLFALLQPRELGGGGAGPLAATVVREEVGAAQLRVARWVLGPDPGALRQVEGELRRLYLEPVLRGEKRSAFAFTEPQDAPAPTSARALGDHFVLDGQKSYVTGGAEADFFLTVVRVVAKGDREPARDGDEGARGAREEDPDARASGSDSRGRVRAAGLASAEEPAGGRAAAALRGATETSGERPLAPAPSRTALLAVDRDLPGVVVAREFESLDGGRHVALRFEGARVPASRLVGEIGEGMPRALRQIGDTRLAVAAFACGAVRWTIEHLSEHLRRPHRSGTPLGERESVRLRFGELRVRAYAARSVLYRTARLAEAGESVVSETMAAKLLATETLAAVVDQAIQLEGGEALVVGHPLERLYREARSLRLAEGASDLLRLQIARGALELGKGRI